jgi:hypothetical protein
MAGERTARVNTPAITAERALQIKECGPNAIVSVMLDGRPDRTEEMVVFSMCWFERDGEGVAECVVTDLELGRWTVDVRHIASVRPCR